MPKQAAPGRARPAVAPRRNVREEIYNAALTSFERHGVRGTLMEGVAREAGVSRPAIYYYFPDKDALVLEVILATMSTPSGHAGSSAPDDVYQTGL
jgi:AcrR family transcriptional regulator